MAKKSDSDASKPISTKKGGDFTTTYTESTGRIVHTTLHIAYNGLGCAECNGLGFTKTYGPEKPGAAQTALV